MNKTTLLLAALGFGLSLLLPSQSLRAQSTTPFDKKSYYGTVFDKSAIEKLKKIEGKELDYLSSVREYESKRKDLLALYSQAKDASTKNKIISKLARVDRRLQRKKNRAYKKCESINQDKKKIYSDCLTKETSAKYNASNKADIDRLKDSTASLFLDASSLRSVASNFDRKGKSEKLEAAFNKEKLALSKYEKAIGILNLDPEYKPKPVVNDKIVTTQVVDNSSKPNIIIDTNKGVTSQSTVLTTDQISKYLGGNPSNLDPKNTNFTISDSILHKHLTLSAVQKKNLELSAGKYNDAQDLFRQVDASYVKIDDLKKQARSIADKDKKESIRMKSQAEDMERIAFIDLNKAINTQLASNEAKHQVYKQILEKQQPADITGDELKRAKQLIGEANQYHNLSVARQKKAGSQTFVSEKYTMLIEANELLQECVRREQNAIALYLDLVNLTAQDKKMLEVYDEEKYEQAADAVKPVTRKSASKTKKTPSGKTLSKVNKIEKTDKTEDEDLKIEGVSVYNISKLSGLFFTVQLGVFKDEITKEEAAGLSPLVQAPTSKGKRYTYGIFKTEAEAKKALAKAKKAGFDQAFVTAYYNKETIELAKGRTLATEGVSFAKVPVSKSGRYYVPVGSFSKELSDEDYQLKYKKLEAKYKVVKKEKNGKVNYHLGPFASKNEAKEAEDFAKGLGVDCYLQTSTDEHSNDKGSAEVTDSKSNKKIVPKQFNSASYKVKLGAYSTVLSDDDYKAKYGKLSELYKIESSKDPETKLVQYYISNVHSKAAADQIKKKADEFGIESYVVVGRSQVKLEKNTEKSTKPKPINTRSNKKDSAQVAKLEVLKDISYKLQIGEFANKLTDDELNAKYKEVLKFCRITTYNDVKGKKVLYLVGEFKAYDEAIVEKENLRKKGVFGTVIAFSSGNKVSLFQARRSEQANKD